MQMHELLAPGVQEKELDALIAVAHQLGSDGSLVLAGSSSVSVKQEATNAVCRRVTLLSVSGRDEKLRKIDARGFSSFVNQRLLELVEARPTNEASLAFELETCRLPGTNAAPPLSALLHAVIPARYVLFAQPVSLMAVASTESREAVLKGIFNERLAVLPYQLSGGPLALAVLDVWEATKGSGLQGVLLLHQGVITFGEEPDEALERLIELNARAEEYVRKQKPVKLSAGTAARFEGVPRKSLAELRHALATEAGAPLILKTWRDPESRLGLPPEHLAGLAPSVPCHLPGYKYAPLTSGDLDEYATACGEGIAEQTDPTPRIIVDAELGICSAGRTADEAIANAGYFTHSIQMLRQAMKLGSHVPLSAADLLAEQRLDRATANQTGRVLPFSGQIAIVTGAASGIGKACATSLLERGAAVVGLDISEKIVGLFDTDSFLGVVCDVADEAAVCNAVDETVLAFGGLDMLVLNAGIFPSGCRIDAMDMAHWEKVMRINLHGNMALMRETYPLLKLAPTYGRVVINGSRNVKAPGPGASAYSASKAALTQLARVAALEWGKDGIRVNVVHPNAVFDTGLYTEEVLKARAASYGITVEQYKKNNVLSVEITSRDIGEMAAEMCGPLFSKVTGAQLSVDGGSDRVI